jgi:hypothetical protein
MSGVASVIVLSRCEDTARGRRVADLHFAILIPPSHGQWRAWVQEGSRHVEQLRYRLETLDSSGRVLAQAPQAIEP